MRAAFALALVSIPAVAQVPEIIATMPNRDNSKISFTSVQGNCETGQKLAYAQSDGGKIGIFGCYQLIGDQVFVKWSDGDVYTYDVGALTLTADFEAYMKKNK
jgi:hypothetical protein